MKLTQDQIEEVSTYIESLDIKWYELQVELTDHFVSIMEEIWSKNSELTFHQVKYRTEERFGKNYFKEVIQERKKILKKAYNKKTRNAFLEFFKFPNIIATIVMAVSIYKVILLSEDTLQVAKKALLFLIAILAMYNLIYWFVFRKIKGKRLLYVEMLLSVNGSYFAGLNFFLFFLKEAPVNSFYLIVFSCFSTLFILLPFVGIRLTHKSINEIRMQYQLN